MKNILWQSLIVIGSMVFVYSLLQFIINIIPYYIESAPFDRLGDHWEPRVYSIWISVSTGIILVGIFIKKSKK